MIEVYGEDNLTLYFKSGLKDFLDIGERFLPSMKDNIVFFAKIKWLFTFNNT